MMNGTYMLQTMIQSRAATPARRPARARSLAGLCARVSAAALLALAPGLLAAQGAGFLWRAGSIAQAASMLGAVSDPKLPPFHGE